MRLNVILSLSKSQTVIASEARQSRLPRRALHAVTE